MSGVNIASIGEIVEDAAEETFLLFSQDIPSNDLGMVNPKTETIEVEVAGRTYEIQQSLGLLKSNRDAGTTGAMLWKVTPLVADWLASPTCILRSQDLLTGQSHVVELGCGIAGLIALALSPMVASYILTDQKYTMKLLRENLLANEHNIQRSTTSKKPQRHLASRNNIHTLSLDWELDSVQNLLVGGPGLSGVDVLVLCDCIFNTFLIQPLLQTCVDICKIDDNKQTVIVIAQQLRSEQVFEEWLSTMLRDFTVVRIGDTHLPKSLRSTSGYVIHLAILGTVQPSKHT